MAVVDGGGGAFEGIDPPQLAALMKSLSSGVSGAQPLASSYVGRFSDLGLDTSRLSKLQADYGWAESQNPMLQRRYNLASHQPSGQWVNGMATSGADYLVFGTPSQAQSAGAKAAQDFKDGKITAQQFYAELQMYEGDPDWATGAVKTLGSTFVQELEQEAATPDDPTGQRNMQALAIAVAAAMGNGVTFPYSDEPDDKGTEDPRLLAPLLQYANFPPQVLATLGKEAMAPGNSMYAAEIFKGLAANPTASAMFIQQNAPEIVAYIHAGDHGGGLPDSYSDAFLKVLQAGTIGIKGTNPGLGGQAVSALVQAYDANSGAHAPDQFNALYGQIVKAYWPDVMFALTSTGDDPKNLTSPDGMHLNPDQWATFIDQAMRDPKTSAMLLDQAHTQGKQWQDLASQQPGGPNAGDLYAFEGGVVDGYFDYQAKTVYSDLVKEGKDAGAWKDKVSEYVGEFVDVGVDVVADPGEAAKTITVGVTRTVITEAMKFGIASIPADGNPPPAPQYSSWQESYRTAATDAFNHAAPTSPLVSSAQGQPFVVNGKIPDASAMTPQQLAAYNAWLNNPTVGQYIINTGDYAAWQIGYNASTTQESLGGG